MPDESIPFGKYRLEKKIGQGGMAEVWRATITGPEGFSRTLVVKRILPDFARDPRFVKMFCSEAKLSARLSHVNIVQVYELGEEHGEYFLAMEYVQGRDLLSLLRALRALGPCAPGFGAFVVHEIARALGYAHALADQDGRPLRLIHRDVTPSNVMVSRDGTVKLLDFGIAKALAETAYDRTRTGVLKGKMSYLAPEQIAGRKDIDHRADLFAAGIVLHEALTCQPLFRGRNVRETLELVVQARVEPPSQGNPLVPSEL